MARQHAPPICLAVVIQSNAGRFGEGRPLALLHGPGSGDGFRRGSVLCRVSSVGHLITVDGLLHRAFSSALDAQTQITGHQSQRDVRKDGAIQEGIEEPLETTGRKLAS